MPAASRRLWPARSAAVAVVFAAAVVPLTMLVGLVINYGWTLQAKARLDLAADAAAIAAARTAAAGYAAGQTSATYMAEGVAAGSQWWTAQAGSIAVAQSFTATPTISQSGQTFTATVAYTATIGEVMPNLFNWNSQTRFGTTAAIANSASVTITVHSYATVDFLLDDTSSMLLPATDADLALLQAAEQSWLKNPANDVNVYNNASNLTGWNPGNNQSFGVANLPLPSVGDYCAFACHWNAASTAANPGDYYGLARQSGETLRFDVEQSATITAIQEMASLEQVSGQYSVGVFAFGGASIGSSAYLSTIFAEAPIDIMTNGVVNRFVGAAEAIIALGAITPPVTGDVPNTSIGAALSDVLAAAGQGGSGNSAASPQKSLILVTDGMEDDSSWQSIPSTEGPINPGVCSGIKNAGYTLYVLYTPYNAEPVYLPFNIGLQPYITGAASPSILSALQSCASSASDVIEASSPSAIQAAMVTLLQEAVGNTLRLTN